MPDYYVAMRTSYRMTQAARLAGELDPQTNKCIRWNHESDVVEARPAEKAETTLPYSPTERKRFAIVKFTNMPESAVELLTEPEVAWESGGLGQEDIEVHIRPRLFRFKKEHLKAQLPAKYMGKDARGRDAIDRAFDPEDEVAMAEIPVIDWADAKNILWRKDKEDGALTAADLAKRG